jgi:hydrogenase maturation protein HypF
MGPGLRLPQGFERAPDLLAMGGELKATFCLTQGGEAMLSAHHGDLEDAAVFDEFRGSLASYARRFAHAPQALVVDRHPGYLSGKLARERARESRLPLIEVQHHHAHVAACLADNGRPLGAPPVLGIVLDGLGWAELSMNFGALEVYRYLESKPRALLDGMLRNAINAPKASSCGRLFDAMAAAVGVCRERQAYEGEAPQRLEALADPHAVAAEDDSLAYPMSIPRLRGSGLPYLEPLMLWKAVLGDLVLDTPPGVMSARFHKGLARAIVAMASQLAAGARFDTVALSGGCFQNKLLFAQVAGRLNDAGFKILSHARVPAHDGGLALGQAAIAAARLTREA